MAKNTAYLVSGKSPLWYNGKMIQSGEVVTDIPGESIGWLLEQGFIVAANNTPAPKPEPEPQDTPDEVPADPSEEVVQ